MVNIGGQAEFYRIFAIFCILCFFLALNKDNEHALHKKTISLRAHPHMISFCKLIRPVL